MRIDLPRCNFKNCRYCFDSNCIKNTEYERCGFRLAKSDAIKEFAERLKKCLKKRTEYDEGGWDVDLFTVTEEDIDFLVKEMTEDKDGNV